MDVCSNCGSGCQIGSSLCTECEEIIDESLAEVPTDITSDDWYNHVASQLSKKGQYKLANAVAHGDELQSLEVVATLKRSNGEFLIITVEGDIFKAVKCI